MRLHAQQNVHMLARLHDRLAERRRDRLLGCHGGQQPGTD
jgi:hypothetical protein